PLAARLSLGRFEAERMTALVARLPLPDALRDQVAAWRVAGVVSRLAIDWAAIPAERAGADGARGRYGIEVAFEQLSVSRGEEPPAPGKPGLPGFANLSGTAQLTERGGTVSLNAEAATLRFPGLFADPD